MMAGCSEAADQCDYKLSASMTFPGRKGDVANGRFIEILVAEHGFGGTAAMEKTG
jgi:hypothetical protein